MSVKLDTTVCRVCLSSSGDISIFDGFGRDDQFRFCTLLEASENDGLPSKLCKKCNSHLKVAYDFRFQAIYAEKYFRKTIFLPSLKQEKVINYESTDIKLNESDELDENMQEIDILLAIHHTDTNDDEILNSNYYDNSNCATYNEDGFDNDDEQPLSKITKTSQRDEKKEKDTVLDDGYQEVNAKPNLDSKFLNHAENSKIFKSDNKEIVMPEGQQLSRSDCVYPCSAQHMNLLNNHLSQSSIVLPNASNKLIPNQVNNLETDAVVTTIPFPPNPSSYSSNSIQNLRMDEINHVSHSVQTRHMETIGHQQTKLIMNQPYDYTSQSQFNPYSINTIIPQSQLATPKITGPLSHTTNGSYPLIGTQQPTCSTSESTASYDFPYQPFCPYTTQTPDTGHELPAAQIDDISNYEMSKEQMRQFVAINYRLITSPESDPKLLTDNVKSEKSNRSEKAIKGDGACSKEKIECNLCGKLFTHISSLKNHMLIHSGQKPFKCEFCNKAFARKTVLNIHRRLHTGQKPYKCNLCDSAHVTKEALLRHLGKEHEAETNIKKVKVAYICSICNKSRCSKYSLAAHMKTHLKGSPDKKRIPTVKKIKRDGTIIPPKYTCKICDEHFENKWEYSKHAETHEINKTFECDICERVFEKKFQLLYHLQTHEGGEELIKAKMQSTVKSSYNINKKMVSKEMNGSGSVKESDPTLSENEKLLEEKIDRPRRKLRPKRKHNVCEDSKSDEGDHINITLHKKSKKVKRPKRDKIHHRENLKAFKSGRIECHICEAVFTHTCSLKSHMLVHSGERPHKCDICDKSFTRKNVLNIHRRLHTGEKPYQCPLCPVTSVTKDALMRHMSKDHDDERELDKVRYTCGVCQKAMGSKYSLQAHMKLHERKETEKDIKFFCSTCNESFNSKTDYTQHMESHEVNKVFQCEICQVTFEKKFKLLFHMQTHKIEESSCTKCGETFTIRENLIQHIKSHIDPKNLDFQCPQCDAGVYDTRDLKLHMLEMHDVSIGEINSCDLCSESYETAAEYYKHVTERHDVINKSCHECNKYFESRKLFDKHMLSHYM